MDQRELLDLLLADARQSTAELARMTDADEETIAALIDELETDGVIQGYQPIIDWDAADTDRVRAEVELNVALDRETTYADIANQLIQFEAVESLQLVSGDFDFLMRVENDSMRAVSRFISDQIAPLPAVTQTVTHYVMDTYKEAGIEFDSEDDDERLSVSP